MEEKSNGKDTEEGNEVQRKDKPYDDTRWGYRHQQSIVLFVYVVVTYGVRSCMSVVLVAMVAKDTNTTLIQPNTSNNVTGLHNTTLIQQNTSNNVTGLHDYEKAVVNDVKMDGFLSAMFLTPPYPKVEWSKQQQHYVLAAFFWGYCVMQIPGGHLAHRFGTRRILTIAMIINSVTFLFAPWMAYYGGWITMAISRVLQGVAQGPIFPALHAFLGKWARSEERARLMSFSYSGVCLGPLVGSLLGGLIAGSYLGWPGALRFLGVLAAIAAAAVWFWLADTPAQHSRISDAEKFYIYEGLGVPDGKKRRTIPWKLILRHPGMMAIIAAHVANSWFLNIILVEMPLFMDNVLKVDVKSIGLLMALPLLIMFLISFVYGWISDLLIVRGWLSIVATRKLLNGFGMVLAAAGLISMEFTSSNVIVFEAILIFTVSTKVASHSGFLVNHIDVSPNYAGVLLGISSLVGHLVSAQTPLVTGLIVRDASSVEQWRIVFHLSAGMLLVAAVLYQWLGTAERAAWDQPTCNQQTIEEAKPMIADKAARG